LKLQDFFEWKSIPTRNIQVEDRADRPMRTSHGAELICGARNIQREIDPTIKLNSLAILERVMRHFYHKAQNSREYRFRG
jgi:hypothetical protein